MKSGFVLPILFAATLVSAQGPFGGRPGQNSNNQTSNHGSNQGGNPAQNGRMFQGLNEAVAKFMKNHPPPNGTNDHSGDHHHRHNGFGRNQTLSNSTTSQPNNNSNLDFSGGDAGNSTSSSNTTSGDTPASSNVVYKRAEGSVDEDKPNPTMPPRAGRHDGHRRSSHTHTRTRAVKSIGGSSMTVSVSPSAAAFQKRAHNHGGALPNGPSGSAAPSGPIPSDLPSGAVPSGPMPTGPVPSGRPGRAGGHRNRPN